MYTGKMKKNELSIPSKAIFFNKEITAPYKYTTVLYIYILFCV